MEQVLLFTFFIFNWDLITYCLFISYLCHWHNVLSQYEWMKRDMAAVDRSKTPWLIFMGYVDINYFSFRFVKCYLNRPLLYMHNLFVNGFRVK